jgi:isoleucyl-tRNA synthetase
MGDRQGLRLQNDIVTAYRNFEFHDIYQEGPQFLRGRARRLLSGHHQGPALHHRREQRAAAQAQTAVHHVAQAMVRWIAPILSFTAEEAWKFLPERRTNRCS